MALVVVLRSSKQLTDKKINSVIQLYKQTERLADNVIVDRMQSRHVTKKVHDTYLL